jgi:DNA replication and repair protein RecF
MMPHNAILAREIIRGAGFECGRTRPFSPAMLTHLRLRDFRCFEAMGVELGSGFNFFLGANGEGKTTLLEAACVLLRLQSQRSPSLVPIIQLGKKSFAVRGDVDGHQLEFRYGGFRRSVRFDGIEQRTMAEYLRIARVVSFANADIELARGSSETRRRYLDFLGSQIDESYRPALRSYERALRGRNALLKSGVARSRELGAFDDQLIAHGEILERLRAGVAELISGRAAAAYERISAGREELGVEFAGGVNGNLAEQLAQSRAEETRLRQTIVGPHRDDLALTINGMPSAQFVSEGQQRGIALALKIAQADVFTAAEEAAPLLLIDDIFGELDERRRNALLDNLPVQSQKLVTATALPWRGELAADYVYHLHERKLLPA